MPARLQLLMRHHSIETTLKHYVEQNAEDVAAELWEQFGNTFGNNTPVAGERETSQNA